MQDFKFSVIFKAISTASVLVILCFSTNFSIAKKASSDNQSGDITADSDLFYEVVSILTEQIVYHNVEKMKFKYNKWHNAWLQFKTCSQAFLHLN